MDLTILHTLVEEWRVAAERDRGGTLETGLTLAARQLEKVANELDKPPVIPPEQKEAITELAHIASSLMDRLQDIDAEFPGTMRQSLRNKITYYREAGGQS